MANSENKNEKLNLQHRILLFLHKRAVLFLGILGALTILVIVMSVYNSVNAKKLESQTRMIESIQDDYQSLASITDDAKKTGKEKKIIKELEDIVTKGDKNYPTERALFMLGNIYYTEENWEKAADNFMNLSELFPKSYLAPVSLLNAAAAYEELENYDKAIEDYQKVVDNYQDISPDADRAMFGIGRLYEAKSDKDAAVKTYNSLIDTFPSSNWTNLARSRIIYLETVK